jgi:hypothetical protein
MSTPTVESTTGMLYAAADLHRATAFRVISSCADEVTVEYCSGW